MIQSRSQVLNESNLVNVCAQGFKVLLAFGIEPYGAAGVHATERHFPGIFTVKGLWRRAEKRTLIRTRSHPIQRKYHHRKGFDVEVINSTLILGSLSVFPSQIF